MSSRITSYGFGWIARTLSGDNRPLTLYAVYSRDSENIDISTCISVADLPDTKVGVSNVSVANAGSSLVYSAIIPEDCKELDTNCHIYAVALCDSVGVIASGELNQPIEWIAGASVVLSLPINIGGNI